MLTHKHTSPTPPARVLLLGAGGFLAPELARLLAPVPTRALGSKQLDLTAPDAAGKLAAEIQPADSVVMAAALTPDRGRDIATLMKNLRMGEAVCTAVTSTKPAHFVYISSDGVYDARVSSLLNEESTCEPADLYCLMHIARERMIEQTCRAASVPLCIVRPCAIYGAGDTHNSYGPNRFIRTARKDQKITLFGGGEEKRHHVHVTDVAEIIRLCLFHASTGVINAVTGEAVSFADVAEKIASAIAGVTVEKTPRANPITHRHFDTSALVRAFPSFSATPLDAGLSAAIDQMP
jgi:nucleoside-diphosphate-sugar epimerase